MTELKILTNKAEADVIGLRLSDTFGIKYSGYQDVLRTKDRVLGGWMYFTDHVTGTSFCVNEESQFLTRLNEVRARFQLGTEAICQ